MVKYTYDGVGNRLTMENDEGITHYTYNELNQLVKEVSPDKTVEYTYNTRNLLTNECNQQNCPLGYDGGGTDILKGLQAARVLPNNPQMNDTNLRQIEEAVFGFGARNSDSGESLSQAQIDALIQRNESRRAEVNEVNEGMSNGKQYFEGMDYTEQYFEDEGNGPILSESEKERLTNFFGGYGYKTIEELQDKGEVEWANWEQEIQNNIMNRVSLSSSKEEIEKIMKKKLIMLKINIEHNILHLVLALLKY